MRVPLYAFLLLPIHARRNPAAIVQNGTKIAANSPAI